ncbi:MAG: hypothetical protein ACPGUV_06975 [Polyangiales bacterium]
MRRRPDASVHAPTAAAAAAARWPAALRRRLALAVLSGCLIFLGFCGFGWWPLQLISFLPLFLALE